MDVASPPHLSGSLRKNPWISGMPGIAAAMVVLGVGPGAGLVPVETAGLGASGSSAPPGSTPVLPAAEVPGAPVDTARSLGTTPGAALAPTGVTFGGTLPLVTTGEGGVYSLVSSVVKSITVSTKPAISPGPGGGA